MSNDEKEKIIKEGNQFIPATPEEIAHDAERFDRLTSQQQTIMACKKIIEHCIREEVFKKNRNEYDSNIIGAAFQVVEMDIQKAFKELFNGVELKNILKPRERDSDLIGGDEFFKPNF